MTDQEVTNLWQRIISLENSKPADYSRVISDIHQQLLGINERLNANNTVFKNHDQRISELKAGVDVALAQLEEQRVKLQNLKPTISLWPRWGKGNG